MQRILILGVLTLAPPAQLLGSLPIATGPVTDYTRWLEREESRWKPSHTSAGQNFSLECYRHPDRKFYIGTKAVLPIKAALSRMRFTDTVGLRVTPDSSS